MPRIWVRAATVVAVVCALSAIVGCQGAGGGGASGGPAAKTSKPVKTDSSRDGYVVALKAVKAESADALLVSVSTPGVALADVPSSWNYLFYSPSDKHLRRVPVEDGTAQPVEDLGVPQVEFDPSTAVEFDSIKVAAAEAVELARAFGEKSGAVPPNVMMGGSFLNAPAAEDIGFVPGSWSVTFIEGTSTEGSREFRVDMDTGEVTAAQD